MNWYPRYDETYHEHNEPVFRPTPEQHECVCGAELTRENPPIPCDCGASACSECVHKCEWCGREGCETCMEDILDGWTHKDECSKLNKECEDRKDREWPQTLERIRRAV